MYGVCVSRFQWQAARCGAQWARGEQTYRMLKLAMDPSVLVSILLTESCIVRDMRVTSVIIIGGGGGACTVVKGPHRLSMWLHFSVDLIYLNHFPPGKHVVCYT